MSPQQPEGMPRSKSPLLGGSAAPVHNKARRSVTDISIAFSTKAMPPELNIRQSKRTKRASALEVGPAVMFLTHLRPNCARSLQFAAGVWARAFKIAAEPS